MVNHTSTNTYGVAKWVVSADATQGTHTTIQSAINSASSGETVFIRDGSYTENLTLVAGVDLAALSGSELDPSVVIIGNTTFSSAGRVAISNVSLRTNSANCLTVSGSAASVLNLDNCYIDALNATGISFSSSSASARLNLNYCRGQLGTSGIAIFSNSSAGQMKIQWSQFSNGGASTTANTASAGTLIKFYTQFLNPTTTSGTNSLNMGFCSMDTSANNAISLTVGGSGTNTCLKCSFQSGAASAVSIGSTLIFDDCSVNSINTNAITGAGTIMYTPVGFNNSFIINTTTQTPAFLGPDIRTQGLSFDSGTNNMRTYLEGSTYTPTLVGATTAGTTTYTTQAGFYTQIGKMIFVDATVVISNSTGTGNMQMSLPFASRNTANHNVEGQASFISMTLPTSPGGLGNPGNLPMAAQLLPNSSFVTFFGSQNNNAGQIVQMNGQPSGGSGTVKMSIAYLLA